MGASYAECSSKEMRGVDEVFSKAVDQVISIEEGYSAQQSNRSGRNSRSKTTAPSGGPRPGKKIKKRTCKIL
jgi:hypothetical protein